MLSPYRVLDCTDHRGELAGVILADLGADVIRVEPPAGSDARRQPPLLSEGPESLRSLQFLAYNRNKRSIALDLTDAAERDTFLELVSSADFVLESGPPGTLSSHGFDFDALRGASPRVVHVRITPFGSDGPYADHAASDLTIAALGGPVSLQGVPGRPPVRVSVPQVWRHAGAEAAVAALVAHARMRRTGEAQHADVSAQCAMTWTMLNAMEAAAIQGRDFERQGSILQLGVVAFPLVFECADGHVVTIPSGAQMSVMVQWMIDAGIVDASWAEESWSTYDARLLAGQPVLHPPEEAQGAMARLLARHSKHELMTRGLAEGLTIAPVNSVADLLGFDHLEARGFWEDRILPTGEKVRTPGAFAKPSARALTFRRSAPALGADGEEIRGELRSRRRAAQAGSERRAPAGDLPFAGLCVADFSWIGVGPISARYLADHGATVVRVESESRPDNLRGVGPFRDGEPGWNRSHFFASLNASKRGLALDLKEPTGIEIARRLIGWADVVLESFTPGTVDKLGIGWDVARELNPSVVMVSTCLMGQTGPASSMAGYGYHAGAVAGFYEVTGFADLPPVGPWMAYTDTIAPRFVAATLMSALDHSRRTGEGQHIDGAQLEMGLHFLAPEILEHQVTGHAATRLGNRSRHAAPQGIYPCAGDDQWCAIAVDTDDQWRGLREALGDPEWARAPQLDAVSGRLARHDAIDDELARFTASLEARQVMEKLLAHGVPAGVVQRSSDLLRDPQYRHRGFYRELEHAEIGPSPYAGHQFRIRGYESGPRSPGPLLGEHSFLVMKDLLGMSDEEIAQAVAAGAVS